MSDLWTKARAELPTRLSPEVVETWFGPTALDGVEDGALVLRVPTRFHGEWLCMHYATVVLSTCREVLETAGEPALAPSRMRFVVDPSLVEDQVPPAPAVQSIRPPSNPPRTSEPPKPDLNPKYTFESFVVGTSNQLAHAASLAAATQPGKRYNPLFLCGGVGLGKTHLVNAIGQQIQSQMPNARILYVSAEKFTNEFITAIKTHSMEQFRATYRESCDVLLMDDIQFIAKRESTMEEFFHTFNALHHLDKQIVVTSDVYPEHLDGMEARIISRFQSGMVADIQAPDVDTRVAILEKKAESEGIVLDKGVANFLAQSVKSNVRELEGTLLRLAVQAELLGKRMDLDLARSAMRASSPRVDNAASVEDIQKAVCEYYGLRLVDLKSKRRNRSISFPRMLAMYLCRQHLGTSYPELGDRFGGKDHTTVIHAIRKITSLVEGHDSLVEGPISAIERKLGI